MCQECVRDSCITTIHQLVAEHVTKTKKLDHVTIEDILATLDSVTLTELGLEEDTKDAGREDEVDSVTTDGETANGQLNQFQPKKISFQGVYEYTDFEMGIFIIPKGACIPLHDHPNMVVFSKILKGALHIRSFDWEQNPEMDGGALHGRVRKHVDDTFHAPSQASILYPTFGGNIHELRALEDSVLLDILLPPYCSESGRPCNYYRLSNEGDYVVQVPEPQDFLTVREEYKGVH